MTAIAIIAASVAAVAVAAMWLWTRPDVRAWLAGHWDRAWRMVEPYWVRVRETLEPHRERLAVAAACLVTLVILLDGGLAAAVAFAVAASMLWRFARAEQAAKVREQALMDAGRGLAARLNKAETACDAYSDALGDIAKAPDLETAHAIAAATLRLGGTYEGDLAAAQRAREASAQKSSAARAERDEALAQLAALTAERDALRFELADKRAWTCTCDERREVTG